jgi:hypothetical protein
LVVSGSSGPQIIGDISSAFNGGWMRCGLTCIQYGPNAAFALKIPSSAFTHTSSVFYYATLDDHSPLPGWMSFDPDKLTLTGTTPSVTTISQRLSINVIVSDVAGFAAVITPFTFVVSNHQLIFDTLWESANIPAGSPVNITNLRNHLYLDHAPIANQYYGSAIILDSPSWITFDPQTITIQGHPPNDITSLNITIGAHDTYGDAAFLEIQLNIGAISLYTGHVGIITAYAGKQFSYQFNKSDFTQTGFMVTLNLGEASDWLHFDTASLIISGTIPWNIQPQLIAANMTISSFDNKVHDYQDFEIQIGTYFDIT